MTNGDGGLKGTLRPASFDLPPAGPVAQGPAPVAGQGGEGHGGWSPPGPPPGAGPGGPGGGAGRGGQAAGGQSGAAGAGRSWILPVAVVGVVIAGLLAFVAARSLTQQAGSTEVRLMAADETGEHPFTESVSLVSAAEIEGLGRTVRAAKVGPDVSSTTTAGPEPAGPAHGAVSVEEAVVYGSRDAPTCDKAALVAALTADQPLLETWAGLVGVQPGEVETYVAGLTPLVLGWDTAVTNSLYRAGEPERFQSVLQAGTAVLVDGRGAPRVQCSCGNPLAPSELTDAEEPRYQGERWQGFEPDAVVTVEAASQPVSVLRTIDLETRGEAEVPLGSSLVLSGYLVDDDTGVYVVGEDGTRTQVLDHPVAAVFDDGAGGLVYQHARPNDGWTTDAPETPDQAAIWHLPGGSNEPVRLIESSVGPEGWVSLEDVDTLHGELAVAYLDMWSTEGGAVRHGTLRVRSLAMAPAAVLIEDAWLTDDRDELVASTTSDVRLAGSFFTWQSGTYDHLFLMCADVPADVFRSGGSVVDPRANSGCVQELWRSHDVTTDRRIVAFDDFTSDATSVQVLDASTGEPLFTIGVDGVFDPAVRNHVDVDPAGRRALVSFEAGGPGALLVDLAAGAVQPLAVTGRTSFLRSPIVRPAAIATAENPPDATTGDQPVATPGDLPDGTVVPSCLTDAEATDILQRTGEPESYREMSVEGVRCADGWADGTLVSGSDGVGLVAFRRTDAGWEFVHGAGSAMSYCEVTRDAGAPAELWADIGC